MKIKIIDENGQVQIVAVQNSFSQSGTERITVEIRTAEPTTNLPEGPLTITIPTRLNESEWQSKTDLLMNSNGYGIYGGVSDDTNNDGIYNLTLNTPADNLTVDTVGIQEAPQKPIRNDGNGNSGADNGGSDNGDSTDGSDSLPANAAAYNDENGNGQYDSGEITYTKSQLEQGFDQSNVDLVITSNTGVLDLRGNEIKANTITLRTNISSRGNEVSLTAQGTIDISGQSIETRGQSIELNAGESGRGELIAVGTTLQTNQAISLNSNGDMNLDQASITAGNNKELEADLGVEDATLFVQDTFISGEDNTLVFEPEDTRISGVPNSGSVSAD